MALPRTEEIIAAFPPGDAPYRLEESDRRLLSTFDGQEFFRKLRGRVWTELTDEEAFWDVASDPVTWLVLMPATWFQYYLPAMMTIATLGRTGRAENLRGLLYLELRRGAPGSGTLLRQRLTDEQRRIVEQFVVALKHGTIVSSAQHDA